MCLLSEVTDSLYVGNFATACNLRLLQRTGITHILVVATGLAPRFPDTFQYYCLPAQDLLLYNILQHLDDTYAFISQAEAHHGKVFVHCAMGRSRSVSVVIAYLMKRKNWTLRKALKFVKSKHPQGQPNSGFMQQLGRYEGMVVRPSALQDWCTCWGLI